MPSRNTEHLSRAPSGAQKNPVKVCTGLHWFADSGSEEITGKQAFFMVFASTP
jgi:hypothetical protein